MDPFKIDLPWLKTRLTETGFFEVIMKPNDLPFENGIALYEISMEFNMKPKIENQASTPCKGFAHFDHPFSLNNGGDSNINMIKNEYLKFEIDQKIYHVDLIVNSQGRLGSMEVTTNDFEKMSFNDAQNTMFYSLNYITNSLSLAFETPIRVSSFLILFELSIFSIVEANHKIKSFNIMDLKTEKIHTKKLDNAKSFYNKGLASKDPQIKFFNLYLACEVIRTLLKEHFNQPDKVKRIAGKGYKEPLIEKDHNFNNNETKSLIGTRYDKILYVVFRNLRNSAAHHLLDDGSYRNTANLQDFKEYYLAIPYLIEIFEGYLTEFVKRI